MRMRATVKKAAALFLLMVCMTVPFSTKASAASKFLFNLMVVDGYSEQKVPVYEYSSGKIKAKKGYRTMYVNRASKDIVFDVTDESDYFMTAYADVKLPEKVTMSETGTKSAKIYVTDQKGTRKKGTVKLGYPAKPVINAVRFGDKSYTPGYGKLMISANVSVQEEVSCLFKVYNSKGKFVYSETVGPARQSTFSAYWDGKAAKSNKAGLAEGAYCPKGKYKVKVYLRYKSGTRTLKVKKSAYIKLKKADPTQADISGVPVFTKQWNWVVMLAGDKRIDYMAEAVCQQILKPGMSEYKRVKAIYKWCVLHFSRTGSSKGAYKIDISSSEAKAAIKQYYRVTSSMIAAGTARINNIDSSSAPGGGGTSWINRRLQGLGKQVGDCTHASAMFETLCRHAGIDCDIIENSLPYTNPLHHVWNVTKVDGVWYYCDARLENARLYGRTSVRYSFLLKGKKVMAKQMPRYGKIKNKPEYKALYKLCSKTDYKKK